MDGHSELILVVPLRCPAEEKYDGYERCRERYENSELYMHADALGIILLQRKPLTPHR